MICLVHLLKNETKVILTFVSRSIKALARYLFSRVEQVANQRFFIVS